MSLFNSVKTGVRDDRGSVALQFGLCAVLLLAVTGGAIDLARWSHAKRTTAAALDAAVLAGAHALQIDPTNITHAIATAQTMYSQNLTGRPTVSSDTVTFVAADSNTAITATGAATIDTTLLRVVGINSLTVVNDAGASFPKATVKSGGAAGGNIEVSIMLDVTGSMCDDGVGPCTTGTKINGLKAAANDLIGIVVSTNQSTYTSKAAIVPFSTRVRVGPDGGGGAAMKAYTNLDPTWTGWYNMCTQSTGGGASETNGSWACQQYTVQQETNWLIKPCVTDRFYDSGWLFDSTDIAPGSGTWLNAHDGSRMPVATDSSSTAATTKTGHSAADPADFWNYDDGTCADVAAGNEILPLTADKTALTARINGLEAYGSTAGALGTAWSWYLLSPNWSSIFGNLYGNTARPGSYADVTTIQANG